MTVVPREDDWGEFLSRYLEESSNTILILLTQDLKIRHCNQGLQKLLDLPRKPLGVHLTDLLHSELPELPLPREIGARLPIRLPVQSKDTVVYLLVCQIINTGPYYLIIGERLLQTESAIINQISTINQELTNLSRELEQKNRSLLDLMETQRRSEAEKDILIRRLQEAQQEIKILSGLLPICSSCKNIRNDRGHWQQFEEYLLEHSEAEFTHSICPICLKKLYGDILSKKDV
jgi:hypothetical protein